MARNAAALFKLHYRAFKRRLRVRAKADKTLITDFPEELLVQIAHNLSDIKDVLNLRLTSTKLERAATTSITDRTKIIYLHPTSLHTLLKVCDHKFSQNVEEVVMLGHVPRQEMNEVFNEGDGSGLMATMVRKFATWPYFFPGPPTIERDVDGAYAVTRLTLNVVTEALEKLPKLHTISFQQSIDRSGLNQTRQTAIVANSKKNMEKSQHEAYFPDIVILPYLVFVLNITTLKLSAGTTLPFAPPLDTEPEAKCKFFALTRLTIPWDLYWDGNWRFVQQVMWVRFVHDFLDSCPNLESLEIELNGHARAKNPEYTASKVFDHSWGRGNALAKLKHFGMRLLPDPNHEKPRRPHLNILDDDVERLLQFLRKRPALKSVHFDNVLFAPFPSTAGVVHFPVSSIDTMTQILEVCREKKIECEWIINKFVHHQECEKDSWENFAGCTWGCGKYTALTIDGGLLFWNFVYLASVQVNRKEVGIRPWMALLEDTDTHWKYGLTD